MNTRQKKTGEAEYEIEEILNKRVTDDGKLEYFLKWKGFPKSESTWEPIENLNCPEMLKNYEESLKNKRKRSFINLKKDGSNGSARKKKSEAYNNNTLPEEILIKIFSYLRQNDLGRMALVCRKWNMCAKYPILWKKIDVYFRWNGRSINKVVECFSERLSSYTTYILLNFTSHFHWLDRLHFEEFCMNLRKMCPGLQSLILLSAKISVRLPSAINILAQFLPNLEVLSFRDCLFGEYLEEGEYRAISNVKVLDLYKSYCRKKDFEKQLPYHMPNLKKLCLYGTHANDFWLGDTSLLQRLHVLQLGWTNNIHAIFQTLLYNALNITVLFLCWTDINDYDIHLCQTGFAQLNTICLTHTKVTYKGIIALIQSCRSLQNIYVSKNVAKKYEMHSFVAITKYKLNIVKAVELYCKHLFCDL